MPVKEPIILCWSGGKDSAMMLYELQQNDDYEVSALVTTVTQGYDRISMHGVRRSLLKRQTAALGLPLHEVCISPGAGNAEYEANMEEAFALFRRRGVCKVAFGDIFLEDLKKYREEHLARFGMKGVFPIWKRETRRLVETFLNLGFQAVTTCVDPKRLDRSFVGRMLDRGFIEELPAEVDPCGENGEFHSFVFDGPNFRHKVPVSLGEVVCRDSFLFCDLVSEGES